MALQNVFAYRINSNETLALSTTSAQSGTTPFGCNVVRVAAHSTAGAPLSFIEVGDNPTALSNGTSMFIHEGSDFYITVKPDSSPGSADGDKIAGITSSGNSNVYITWLEG